MATMEQHATRATPYSRDPSDHTPYFDEVIRRLTSVIPSGRPSFRAEAEGRSRGIAICRGRGPSIGTIAIPRLRRFAAPLGMTWLLDCAPFGAPARNDADRVSPHSRVSGNESHTLSLTTHTKCRDCDALANHRPSRPNIHVCDACAGDHVRRCTRRMQRLDEPGHADRGCDRRGEWQRSDRRAQRDPDLSDRLRGHHRSRRARRRALRSPSRSRRAPEHCRPRPRSPTPTAPCPLNSHSAARQAQSK